MPYTVISNAEGCSGYAVVKEGETVPVPGGCHALKSDAIVHMVALQYQYMEEEIEEDEEEESEDEEEEERQAPNLVAPAFMKASARRGLRLHEEGFSGDGLKPQTVEDARKMAEGTALSEDKWRRIAPWLARHIGDLDAVQGDEITPGLVAMLLWGGGSSKSSARRAQAYAERIVAQLDEKRYDPDQPRDEDGKFDSVGGGGGGGEDGDEGGDLEIDWDEWAEAQSEVAEKETKVQEVQDTYIKELDPMQVQAIEIYTSEGYRNINRFYRGAPPPPLTPEQISELDFTTTLLESAIGEAPPITDSVTVYRGVSERALGIDTSLYGEEALNDLVGSRFRDEGIVSTSFNPDVAATFGGNQRIVLEIEAPKGTTGLAVGELSSEYMESEFLLPPGTAFEVVGVGRVGNQPILKVRADN